LKGYSRPKLSSGDEGKGAKKRRSDTLAHGRKKKGGKFKKRFTWKHQQKLGGGPAGASRATRQMKKGCPHGSRLQTTEEGGGKSRNHLDEESAACHRQKEGGLLIKK